MKKIYIILIVVIVLSSSGIGIYAWSKKKKDKAKKAEEEEPTVVEKPALVEKPVPIEEKPLESALNSEMPAKLLTDISIDYIKPYSLEIGYNMHYKGVSHKGTFKHGDKSTVIKKSLATFSVAALRKNPHDRIDDKPISHKAGKLNGYNAKEVEEPIVYLFIINKSEVVKGLKVNLRTGDQIEGLPKDWSEFDGLD